MYYIESLDVLLSTDVNQKEVSVCRNEKTFDKKFKFPKSARLRKTDEFLSVFNFRPLRYSAHFVIYKKQTNLRARLGLVINKRYAPYAVTRNFIKRRAREAFRLRQSEFNGWDLLLKLNRKFDEKIIQGASSTALAIASIDEIYELLDYAA